MRACAFSLWQSVVGGMILGLVAASPAAAQKADVVTLANGDTLTCEIKSLNRGRLTADTDNMSTVSIEWDKVASVTSSRVFQVETSAGRRLFGALGSKTPGHVEVVNTSITESFDLIDIVLIMPIGEGFWQRLEGSL